MGGGGLGGKEGSGEPRYKCAKASVPASNYPTLDRKLRPSVSPGACPHFLWPRAGLLTALTELRFQLRASCCHRLAPFLTESSSTSKSLAPRS